jgi:hypothetical protein
MDAGIRKGTDVGGWTAVGVGVGSGGFTLAGRQQVLARAPGVDHVDAFTTYSVEYVRPVEVYFGERLGE